MSTIEAARDAQRRAQELAARRDAEVAALADAGESYAQIAARLGVTRQRVGQYVKAHRERNGR